MQTQLVIQGTAEAEFMTALALLASSKMATMDEMQMRTYWSVLKDLNHDDVLRAIVWFEHNGGRFVPSASEIRARARGPVKIPRFEPDPFWQTYRNARWPREQQPTQGRMAESQIANAEAAAVSERLWRDRLELCFAGGGTHHADECREKIRKFAADQRHFRRAAEWHRKQQEQETWERNRSEEIPEI